jgi:hypothetical protein
MLMGLPCLVKQKGKMKIEKKVLPLAKGERGNFSACCGGYQFELLERLTDGNR